jgi:hypothetical protein
MKRTVIALIALLACFNALSEGFMAEGIRYKVTGENSVEVIQREADSGKYTGRLAIPASVANAEGKRYKVTAIGSMAFLGCREITGVSLPPCINSIGSRAFEGSGITNITLPVGIKSLGKCAFLNCRKLTDITLPVGVSKIEYGVFRNCTNLTSIKIPPKVDTIDYLAFDSCYSLQAINIPASVKFISPDAFLNCRVLVTVSQANRVYSGSLGVLYNKRKTKLVFCPTSDSIYRIPPTVRTIGEYAFWGRKSLKRIIIPSSVKRIEDYAFARSGLTSLKLPKSVSAVGPYSFAGCMDLKGLDIPDSIYKIDAIGLDSNITHKTNITSPDEGKLIACTGGDQFEVEQGPKFQGGFTALYNYMNENLLYPTSFLQNKFGGRVYANIIIDKDGLPSRIIIGWCNNLIFAKEAVRLVKSLPPWIHGKAGNKPIKAIMFLPIVFKN